MPKKLIVQIELETDLDKNKVNDYLNECLCYRFVDFFESQDIKAKNVVIDIVKLEVYEKVG